MKTILVATDFSAPALNASHYAADMALTINADLCLLYIFRLPVSYNEVAVPVNERDFIEDAEKSIKELKQQLSERTGGRLNISTGVRTTAFFRQELAAVCEEVKPYAVVMGSQGTTAAEHLFFGSHTVFAMKNLEWPLITVPPGATFSSIKKIGLAVDLTNAINTIPLHEIKILVNDFNAHLHVLHSGMQVASDPDIDFKSSSLKEMLSSLHPHYHFITSEYTDEAIMNFAEKNNIDLLIVFPKRHDLLGKLIHKSHSKQMILHCHVPVMALHL